MKHNKSPFKWRHFEPTIILLCVRWYCRDHISYRDLEEMMLERGLAVEPWTVFRWVQRSAPEISKRIRQQLKLSGTSYVIEQEHRFIKKKVRASPCFKRFHPAGRTLEGIEAVNRLRKGQVKRLAGSDALGQARFVASLFQMAA